MRMFIISHAYYLFFCARPSFVFRRKLIKFRLMLRIVAISTFFTSRLAALP